MESSRDNFCDENARRETDKSSVQLPPANVVTNRPTNIGVDESQDLQLSEAVVQALSTVERLSGELEQTLSRAALRDSQHNSLQSQVSDLSRAAVEGLQSSASREGELVLALRRANDAVHQIQFEADKRELALKISKKDLENRCTSIVESVQKLQVQFSAEREARIHAERVNAELRLKMQEEVSAAKEAAKHEASVVKSELEIEVDKSKSELSKLKRKLAHQHQKYTQALVAKLEHEAAQKVKQHLRRHAEATADLKMALQQQVDSVGRYKAELLHLKKLHCDCTARAHQLQIALHNLEHDQNRRLQEQRDRLKDKYNNTEALLRREVMELEERLSSTNFSHERQVTTLKTEIELERKRSQAQQARLEVLVATARQQAQNEIAAMREQLQARLKIDR